MMNLRIGMIKIAMIFFASHRNFYLMLSLYTKYCILKCILSEYLETLLLAITDVTANLFNKCVIYVSSID